MERKKNEEVIRKLDKLSAVGQLAAGVAHEIRNPLTSIKGFLQLFQSQLPSELNKEYWDIVFSELNRIELIVNEFMVLAKPQSVPLGRLNLNRIIHNTIKLFDTQAILHNISIKIRHVDSEKTQIIGNENHLKQLLINVLKNSLEATPKFGKILIKIELFRESNVRIRVIDNGKGITKEKLSMIGTPFYTTKEKGIGLGLTMSQKIVQEHNGTFRILSKRCFGTIVDIELPTV
ncbi:ATP-binding protein [Halalkalibacterium ligniniphilum]|uniref:ATP-binding protein n=1 Tax=Halalkalibacterium ligniniphilum TaxID=1134413 RepID=UPI0003478F00|nr:ATP-binding protein [Halalkalibacterium ligniniphilum]